VRGEGDIGIEFPDALPGHVDQQLLGGNQRDLQVAVRVAFGEQHVHDVMRQRGQQAGILGAEPAADESRFGVVSLGGKIGGVVREDIVQFGDHGVHFRDELDQAFRRQQDAVVHSPVRTFDDDPRDAVDDARQRLLVGSDFFGDQGDRRLGLQCDFECDMRSRAAHQLDEVPVLER